MGRCGLVWGRLTRGNGGQPLVERDGNLWLVEEEGQNRVQVRGCDGVGEDGVDEDVALFEVGGDGIAEVLDQSES